VIVFVPVTVTSVVRVCVSDRCSDLLFVDVLLRDVEPVAVIELLRESDLLSVCAEECELLAVTLYWDDWLRVK